MKLNKHMYPVQTGLNNPILRQVSAPVEKVDHNIVDFAQALIELMWEYDGVGLAAPQVGKNIRMVAVTHWNIKGKKWHLAKQYVMINPEIVFFSVDKEIEEEGCISLPGMNGDVERSKEIEVRYLDITGKSKTVKLSGMNARIVQHEVDHLNGILFADKIIKKDIVNLDKFLVK